MTCAERENKQGNMREREKRRPVCPLAFSNNLEALHEHNTATERTAVSVFHGNCIRQAMNNDIVVGGMSQHTEQGIDRDASTNGRT
jgi:hypothetical protein